jgi:hypothetical protein
MLFTGHCIIEPVSNKDITMKEIHSTSSLDHETTDQRALPITTLDNNDGDQQPPQQTSYRRILADAIHSDIEKTMAPCHFYFSAYNGQGASQFIQVLVGDNSYKHKIFPPTHAYSIKCNFIPDFHFTLFILMEQEAYQDRNNWCLKWGGPIIFHFDLSDQQAAKLSYHIAKNQIRHCRDPKQHSIYLIGFASEKGTNPIAQEWFQKFSTEENIESSSLICEVNAGGVEILRQYIRQIILQAHSNLEQEYGPAPEQALDEDNEENDSERKGCGLM